MLFFRPAFERYSPPVRQVLILAIRDAQARGDDRLNAEHLARGLLGGDVELLRKLIDGSDPQAFLDSLLQHAMRSRTTGGRDLPLGSSAKAVLKEAEELADQHHRAEIGIPHLLAGALLAKSPAADLLTAQGIAFRDVEPSL